MPLVIPQNGPVAYIRDWETLSELLGHSNFDGEPWAVGDRIIFESGMESRIEQVPDDSGHTWPEPVPADLQEVSRAVGFAQAENWQQLFSHFEASNKRSGCAAAIVVFAVAAASAAAAV